MRDMNIQLGNKISSDENHEGIDEIKVMADDGRVLYYISMTNDGELEVSTGAAAKFDGKVKDTTLTILPKGSNRILLTRPDYK